MKLISNPIIYKNGIVKDCTNEEFEQGKNKTLASKILNAHDNHQDVDLLHLKFDSLTSHDITYVGIIQTARASGLNEFPVPYVLTNCHNTLCAVGGTINEDDHRFALSAAHKYGGIYVPPNMAVIHSFNREMMAGCGKMILGSDSHTRYGALGTLAIGEGGGELAKQLLGRTYDIKNPDVVLIHLTGSPKPGVGPHDVALSLIAATYSNGFVKNCIMEFAGSGISSLSQDYRNAIDVMTTETTCLSSIWETDEKTEKYFVDHGRPNDYKKLEVDSGATYARAIELDLGEVESMIALPMHPSYALPINELKQNPVEVLRQAQDKANEQLSSNVKMDLVSKVDNNGNVQVDQGVIAGCSGGTYGNIMAATSILADKNVGNGEFRLSFYPDSMPVYKALAENGCVSKLVSTGAIFREAFCGPCFGAGDTPANGELSIRHTTRNFANREGSKPGEGQISAVALMDARSIAATAANQGVLTAATDVFCEVEPDCECKFDKSLYDKRVYNGFGKAKPTHPLHFGPNIKDWPTQPALKNNLLLKICSHIDDPVTTTDELIPSGETSSFRSNPLRLAEFTLSRRDPDYVKRAKAVESEDAASVIDALKGVGVVIDESDTLVKSAIYANKPGDGSAREQAASCQRVLGGGANFAKEYATKRYRSNCINWGMLPFLVDDGEKLKIGNWVLVPNIISSLDSNSTFSAFVISNETFNVEKISLSLGELTETEKQILKDGCLINYYKNH